MELKIRCSRCVVSSKPRLFRTKLRFAVVVFEIVLILLWLEATCAKSQEHQLWQGTEKGDENIISHSCIHDEILEQRRRPGRKVYSVTPQVYEGSGISKTLHRKGRALLGISKSLEQQNDVKQPIRIYLNYDAVGHSTDRDCRNVGDIVKLGEPPLNSNRGVPSCNPHGDPPIFGDCWYNCTSDDISGDDKRHRLRKALGQTADWFKRALAVEPVKGNLRLSGYSACGQDGGVQLPREYVEDGVVGADLVLLVTTRPTTGNTLAWAVACERDQWGRAVAGHVNVAPRHLTAEAETLLSATLIHEVMHVLGFDPHAFAHFRDERKRRRNQVTEQVMDDKLGRMVTRVVLPRVIMHSRYHYGAFSENFTGFKKPLLVIGPSPSPSPSTPEFPNKLYGKEVVNKRIRVYWPLDQSWYDGSVKSFDKVSGKHLIQYDDAEEELLDLVKEKVEWGEEQVPRKFRRLRCVSVIEDDEEEEAVANAEEVENDDDSTDEDWGKNVETQVAEDVSEEDMDMEDEDEDDDDEDAVASGERTHGKKNSESRKRKTSGGGKFVVESKKRKSAGDAKKSTGKVTLDGNGGKLVVPKDNGSGNASHVVGDAAERFGMRETQKLRFLGQDRRDANRRRPGDVNYDPTTLYLPPDFVKSLSGGQRQWWEFKSKHMDKVLFFKMGKFYELFEMDAHVGAKELDLQYMKGDQPHCGFPEKNFSINVEKLARKGYRVLVVEQTETPEQLELRRKEKGSKDKVVKREICAVVTKGTLTEGEMMSTNPEASYLMAVTESCQILANHQERIFGVCVVDVATSKVILGQFQDDPECSALCCLLSELRPVEIIKPAKLLSSETERVLLRHTRSPLVNELVPLSEFWDAEKTVCEVKAIYSCINKQSVSSSTNDANLHATESSLEDGFSSLPDVLSELVNAGDDGSYALSALGGSLFYLKQAFMDETLLRFAKFELLPCSGFSDIGQRPYMMLDAAALENLEIFENSRNGDSSGTLYAQLNHCMTAFGKRLLKTWLARPLYHLDSIRERQDAVAGLKGVNLPYALEFRKDLTRLPDMERLLARIFASSEANGRNANEVVLYEDASKKQLQEFISALRGCELMTKACSSFGVILENVGSRLLHHLLTPGKGFPDIHSVLKHFKDLFDWVEANSSGRIIPRDGVDMEYDSACRTVKEVESSLNKHVKEQRKLLGDLSINYVTIGKDAYLLEVPESLSGSVPRNYELRSSKKGFFRYWNPTVKKLIGELSHAEAEKESKLKSILHRLVGRFCEHHNKWRQLVSTIAELDVLISLAIASDYYEGPTCRPIISGLSCPDEVPSLCANSLGHPVLRSDSLGKSTFVPNNVIIGGSGNASFILLTGPNMGGKSTLLRQVCLAVILAQVGADVPAESFEMSPVDRIFVRMGAKDHIMAGQSTFLTELLETASMLSLATRNSLVALDELGRGTSTSDGQAIAESVLEHFVHKVQCRGMFSTHYHRLALDYQEDPRVSLCHMACQVGEGVGGLEEVTFLYRLTPGACPKSYGVNVARIAGLPDSILHKAAAKSQEFEGMYGKHRKGSKDKLPIQSWADKVTGLIQHLVKVAANLNCRVDAESISVNSLNEMQHRARMLLKQN